MKNQILKTLYYISKPLNLDKNTRRILCYHSVSENGNKYTIAYEDFVKQILTLKKYFAFVSLDEIIHSKKFSLPLIALTFDDGYTNIQKIAGFLKKEKIPAAIFVISNPKQVNRYELDSNEKLLSVKAIKKIHKLGLTIGCHSATHADFSNLTNKKINEEVHDSKITLEKALGFSVDYFAYPKGVYNTSIIETTKKAGYKAAFTTFPAVVRKGSNPSFNFPRFVMEKNRIFFTPEALSYSTEIIRTLYLKVINKSV